MARPVVAVFAVVGMVYAVGEMIAVALLALALLALGTGAGYEMHGIAGGIVGFGGVALGLAIRMLLKKLLGILAQAPGTVVAGGDEEIAMSDHVGSYAHRMAASAKLLSSRFCLVTDRRLLVVEDTLRVLGRTPPRENRFQRILEIPLSAVSGAEVSAGRGLLTRGRLTIHFGDSSVIALGFSRFLGLREARRMREALMSRPA